MTSNLSFQSVQTKSTLSDELRSAIRDNILFFVQDQEPEEEGITALYERLSQEDKLDGESNSIANQKSPQTFTTVHHRIAHRFNHPFFSALRQWKTAL